MAINDVLKSYLISLGYEVDSKAYNQFTSTLRKAETEVTKHSGKVSSAFTKAGLAYVSAIGTIAASTGLLLKSLASQEMEYQKTALTLHMAKDAAKQYSIALKVLGEPPEMIAWLPVLREQYRVLRKDSQALELPKAYTEGVHELEAMNLEFKRLKQESMYALQWIGFSIMKHLAGPIDKARENFKAFNDRLIQQMPEITDSIGKVFGGLLGMLKNVGKSLMEVGKGLGLFWDMLSPTSKAIVGIGLLLFLFSKAGPFGQAVIAIGLATAAASEFWDAMEGKETVIPIEIIQKMIQLFDGLARIVQLTIGIFSLFWNSITMHGLEAVNTISKVGLAMKKTKLAQMENSGQAYSKEEKEAQRADIAAHEKAIQERQSKIQLKEKMTDAYAIMAADAINKWDKIGLSAQLMEKSGGKIGWDREQRKAETQRQQREGALKGTFISPIGTWGQESPTAGINYGMKGIEKYSSIIEEASKTFGVPAELIKAMIKEESGGKAGAVSPVGAMGLMQIMPGTAKELGIPLSELTDPRRNIFGGAEYMSKKLKETKGDIPTALAAYNAGFGAVQKYKGQIPPYRETQDYVKQVMGSYRAYGEAAGTSIQGGIHVSVGPISVSGEGKEAGQKVAEGIISGLKGNEYIGFLFTGITPNNYAPVIGPAVERPATGIPYRG